MTQYRIQFTPAKGGHGIAIADKTADVERIKADIEAKGGKVISSRRANRPRPRRKQRINLTTNQRIALRQIAGDSHTSGKPSGVVVAALRKMDLVDEDGNLTAMGVAEHAKVMNGGNGPEHLKAMFRF